MSDGFTPPGRRGVLVGQGQSLGQLAAGVHPAGEHGPVIAPLAVQDILQQVMVLVGVATPRHSGRNWTGCYTIRSWNMHSLCWVERWSTIVPSAAPPAG